VIGDKVDPPSLREEEGVTRGRDEFLWFEIRKTLLTDPPDFVQISADRLGTP
jgi:hypothetical protein